MSILRASGRTASPALLPLLAGASVASGSPARCNATLHPSMEHHHRFSDHERFFGIALQLREQIDNAVSVNRATVLGAPSRKWWPRSSVTQP